MRLPTLPRATRDGVFGIFLGGTLVLTAALAAEDMMMMDTDGDGLVSYAEAVTTYPDLTEAEFQALDADANGGLDADEIAVAREAGMMMSDG